MSKRERETFMSEDDGNLQSPETPTPKVARTTDANNAPFSLLDMEVSDLSTENLNCPIANDGPSNSSDLQKSGLSKIHQKTNDDALSQLMLVGSGHDQAIKHNSASAGDDGDKENPIADDCDLDSSRDGASTPSSLGSFPSDIVDRNQNIGQDELQQLLRELEPQQILRELEPQQDVVKDTGDEKIQRFLQEVVRDPPFLDRLKRFVLSDSKSVLITGERERDPKICHDSQEFLNCLDFAEPEFVAGHLAAALQRFLEQKQNNSGGVKKEADNRNPIASTSGCGSTQMEGCPSPSVWVEKGGDTPVVYTKQEVSSLPELATSVGDYIPHTSDAVDSASDAGSQPLTLPNRIWEKAFDFARLSKREEKLKKMAQILFVEIFTENEILECRVGGKNNAKVFNDIKVRFLYYGVAWLLGEPPMRSQEQFDHYVHTNGQRLTEQDMTLLRKSVFTEFAYSQRNRIKKSKTN